MFLWPISSGFVGVCDMYQLSTWPSCFQQLFDLKAGTLFELSSWVCVHMYICLCSYEFLYCTSKPMELCESPQVPDALQPSGVWVCNFWPAQYSDKACTDPLVQEAYEEHFFPQSIHWQNSHAQQLWLWIKAQPKELFLFKLFPTFQLDLSAPGEKPLCSGGKLVLLTPGVVYAQVWVCGLY